MNKQLPQLDELYKEIILEHYRKPHGREALQKTDYQAEGVNPFCGDEIKLGIEMINNKIKKVYVEGHGCSISVASGSMLADMLCGKTIDEAKSVSKSLRDLMHDKSEVSRQRPASTRVERGERASPQAGDQKSAVPDIGDLEALSGVKKFPVRIKCALLPWTTLEEALVGHKHVEIV